MAESVKDGSCKSGQINHGVGLDLPFRVDKRIGEDEPSFGVGIEDFNRGSVHCCDEVTRLVGLTIREVF